MKKENPMSITEEIKRVIQETAFLSLVTVNSDGSPHLIIAGKGEVAGDAVIFGIYKMERTQANLLKNKNVWIAAATMTGGKPKGYRLIGAAEVTDKQLIVRVTKAEDLI
jgi:predicted pyridoxine 5'-phosphate oxidase superfamily flavin-nucleotide-binding protein